MDDFVRHGEPLHDKAYAEDASQADIKAWNEFVLRAKLALVLHRRDTMLRKDCSVCERLEGYTDNSLTRCGECGEFKTYHYQCHWCDVLKAICHV